MNICLDKPVDDMLQNIKCNSHQYTKLRMKNAENKIKCNKYK